MKSHKIFQVTYNIKIHAKMFLLNFYFKSLEMHELKVRVEISVACRQWGKRANLKTGVTRKQSTPNFPKNEHFLPLDTHTQIRF